MLHARAHTHADKTWSRPVAIVRRSIRWLSDYYGRVLLLLLRLFRVILLALVCLVVGSANYMAVHTTAPVSAGDEIESECEFERFCGNNKSC